MRDALVVLVILASLLVALRYPFAGLLLWAWFSLMTPHQMAFGAWGIPLNALIAGVTLVSLLINGEFSKMRLDAISLLFLLFAFALWLSQTLSLAPDISAQYFDRFIKTIIFAFLVSQLANTKLRLHAMTWMLVVAIGYFAAKGAVFTVLTLGEYRVGGVADSILEDNNHIGIGMATILPLVLYLRGEASRPATKFALLGLAAFTVFAILGTHSRGAFLSLMAFAGYFWLQSKHKVSILGALMIAIIPAIMFLPSKWMERMTTISSAMQDESFLGRVNSWKINTEFAMQNPLSGAGLRVPYEETIVAEHIGPEMAEFAIAGHSIYFEILGGAGFFGLAIYLSLLATAFFASGRLARQSADPADWRGRFGYFSQISLVAFMIGGASVSLEMWDGYLIVVALIAAASRMPATERKAARRVPQGPRWRAQARGRAAVDPSPASLQTTTLE